MKKILMVTSLLISTTALADITSTATLTSDYVWRGVTQTGHDSAVQGSMDYNRGGFGLGVWASSLGGAPSDTNAQSLGQEVDLYLQYEHKINDDNAVTLGAVNYTYTRNANANFGEYFLKYTHKYAELYIGSSSDYLATDSSATYVNLSTGFTVSEKDKVTLKLSVGQTSFGDEEEAGMTNYSDYKVALSKMKGDYEVEMFLTGTSGRESGTVGMDTSTFTEQEDDSTVGFAISISF